MSMGHVKWVAGRRKEETEKRSSQTQNILLESG
jgi:hypothetical protein